MTRLDLLQILIGQARANGFDFRRWFTTSLRLPWEGQCDALDVLESQRRYYALLFHHDFAKAFWNSGNTITFQVPAQKFERRMPDGSVRIIERKPFLRRSGRPDPWRYHLSQMALSNEPLRYMRKYLRVEEDLIDDELDAGDASVASVSITAAAKPKPVPPPRALGTLALARKAAERRKAAVAALPSAPVVRSTTRRTPRLPGSR
jgi:hypothetical protein